MNVKTAVNTRLLTENDFGIKNSFIYIGNILPLTCKSIMADVNDVDSINNTMNKTSENLIRKFNLIGSNGVDYIHNENGLYVIEINPRLQGTFECVEMSLGINMLNAHIRACQGELIEIPEPKLYSYKKIIYSPTRMKYQKIDLDNIYDLPHIGSITEKSEPLLTIIDKDKDFKKLCEKVESASKTVNNEVRKHQVSEQ
jgi:predicted ATP-grasp superfamily ATP-dependent carboligase